MKKSFSLLITIFIVALFSLLISQIVTSKNINSNNITQEYLYTQAKLDLDFYQSLILKASSIECGKNIYFTGSSFEVFANTKCIDTSTRDTIVDLFVKSKKNSTFKISLHKRFLKRI